MTPAAEPDQAPRSLTDVLDAVEASAADKDRASVDDLLETFGTRSFGPLLVAPGIITISPLGAIPGAPAIMSTFIILICLQYIAGRSTVWLPGAVRDRSVSKDKLHRGVYKVRPWARRLDALFSPRLRILTVPPLDRALAAIAMLLAASIYIIGLIPFAAAVPSSGIVFIGLALTTRDGLVALLALASIGGTIYFAVSALG